MMDSRPDFHEYCTGGYNPDDIVISGLAGQYPECDTVGELKDALFSKKDLIIYTDSRFAKGTCDLPFSSYGMIKDLDKFDADFFCVPHTSAHTMDPGSRKLMEVSYQCIIDSGYDPYDLRGQKIGVYNSAINDDSHQLNICNGDVKQINCVLRFMLPNRTSYAFDFMGPSFSIDTGCSSFATAFWCAFNDIKENRVEAAIVNAAQINLDPRLFAAYINLGVQTKTGNSFPFDARTDGILRSETVTGLFLQKASVARRSYCRVVNTIFIGSGHVVEGISVPSVSMQTKVSLDILESCGVSADEIDFIEAHGTGTSVGDPIELNAIADAYLPNRKKPLYVGTIKGNVGHTEAASGGCGLAKAIIAFETGYFPPNMRYSIPNPGCQALVDGKLEIVTETMPLTGDYMPVNSFGFGGTLVQIMLKRNPIVYSDKRPAQNSLPQLILYPATTEVAILELFEYIKNTPHLQKEFFALIHKLSFTPTSLKPFRGYGIFQKEKETIKEIKNCSPTKRPVWFIMTGMGCQWPGMGTQLMAIDIFAESMKASAAVLKPLGIDLFEIIHPEKNLLEINRKIIPAFVAIASIQIALVDVLRSLDIIPDGIIGHSTGELAAAYADGSCTAEETILSAYWRGKCTETADLPEGLMAAVGLSWEQAVKQCPEGVYPACDNAEDSVTIGGLKENVENFVQKLKSENVFARAVNAYGYAFHTPCIAPATTLLKPSLQKVMRNSKPRSNKWISTSHPESDWEKPCCKMAGADYFVNNLVAKVRFNEAVKKIPSDAVTIEIGPHFLLQSILKRSVGPAAAYLGLMKRNEKDGLNFFMESLGKLYNEGIDPIIERLYPPVKFPVPRATPMISDLVKWNHSQSFFVPEWTPSSGVSFHEYKMDKTESYLMDHYIDGRSLFPATGYIFLAWEALAKKIQKRQEIVPVVIQNFKIHKATIIYNQTPVKFYVDLSSTGSFEISEGNSLIASGEIHEWKNVAFSEPSPTYHSEHNSCVSGADVYNELKMSGYEYGPAFRGLIEMNMEGTQGLVLWQDKWIPYLDSLLLFFGFINNSSDFCLPTGVLSFKIDPNALQKHVENETGTSTGLPVNFNSSTSTCRSVGVEIRNLSTDSAAHRVNPNHPTLEEYKFVPYVHIYTPEKDSSHQLFNYMHVCNKTIEKIGKHLGIGVSDFKFPIGSENSISISEYMENLSVEQQLLITLKEISNNPTSVKNGRKEFFSTYVQRIGQDMINNLMTNEYPLRILTEIISENSFRKLKVVEVKRDIPPVLPSMMEIIKKFSYVKFSNSSLVCSSDSDVNKDVLEELNIQLYSDDMLKTLTMERNQDLAISSFLGGTRVELELLIRSLSKIVKPNGFILLFYKSNATPPENLLYSLFNENQQLQSTEVLEKFLREMNLITLATICDKLGGSVYLLRASAPVSPLTLLKIKEEDSYSWVENVKVFLSKKKSDVLWLVTEDDATSGIVGMVNCLKQEPGGERIRCVFISKKNKDLPPFSFEHPCYKQLLEKNLIINICKDGLWGSFRHVLIKNSNPLRSVEHSYVSCKKYGDLSSFEWIESNVKYATVTNQKLIHIYYSALNFRDVMLATGKLSIGTAKIGDSHDDSVLGLEFSGRDSTGRRVAGFMSGKSMATSILTDPLTWIDVPDNWTLEEAATVPVVYATCYYALTLRTRLRRGESILIHSGTGGIGLAAINIALFLQCEIFTTVGNDEKRKYLKEKYPQIKDENIGCSRDTSFELMIMERTNGKGVNVVLNSLADDKFQASIRCVAKHGRFVEIGKYDMSLDRKIGLKKFLQNITFCGVYLDQLFEDTPEAKSTIAELMQMVRDGIKDKVVKPLDRTVFERKNVEEAFRYMSKGVHVGKVLLKIREERDNGPPKTLKLPAIPKTYFYPSKVYIVIGGLGGFGIEVTKWIISRGGKNIILTSRYGARTPYHHLCLRRWKKSGYNVQVSTLNVAHASEAEKLLTDVSRIGPVGGIFNSAVVLKDAFMDCQNAKSYEDVCAPKATATKLLDELSRKLCPTLDLFVCFSSISCGRGNAGQTNYGYANSVMERVCEQRRSLGLHGLAIQWGIIGEVGVVHRHMGDDARIAGVASQTVRSCLEALDSFCQMKSPVVSSYVNAVSAPKANKTDALTQLTKILGLKDMSEINTTRNFGEMGVDSMVGIEVKQLLETSCDVSLTLQEIFDLKIADVQMLLEKAQSENASKTPTLVSTTSIKIPEVLLHTEPLIALNKKEQGTPIFIVYIGDADISLLHLLGEVSTQPVFALLWTKAAPNSDMKTLAAWYLKIIEKKVRSPFHLVGYSLGGSLAVEIALQSEKSNNKVKTIALLDGSTNLRKALSKERKAKDSEIRAVCEFVEQFTPEGVPQLEEKLSQVNNLEQRIGIVLNFLMICSDRTLNKNDVTDAITNFVQKSALVEDYYPSDKLTKDITLIEDTTRFLANDITEVKELFSQVCSGKINIHRAFSREELSNKEALKNITSILSDGH